MKTKKLFPILALTACITCLSACGNMDQKISFGNYWQTNALITENMNEKLVYDVKYTGAESSMYNYTLQYSNGQYVTELTSGTENGKNILIYKTQLTINVSYTYQGVTSELFEDKVVSEVKFYTAENSLRPISSYKEIVSTSPSNSATSLESCYQAFHYEMNVVYNDDCSGGTSTVTENPNSETPVSQTMEFKFDEDKYSRLDNETLLFAIRGVPTTTSSAKVQTYSPFVKSEQLVSFTFTEKDAAEFTYTENGESKTKNISYRSVAMVLNEKNPGATQTAWYAKASDTTKNTYRNVMLRLETPLSYGLGSLVYTLKSIETTTK